MSTAKLMPGRTTIVSIGFYTGLVVLAVLMWLLTEYINNRPYSIPPPDDPAALSKAEDAYAAVVTCSLRWPRVCLQLWGCS